MLVVVLVVLVLVVLVVITGLDDDAEPRNGA
jgi:hypothetical protein